MMKPRSPDWELFCRYTVGMAVVPDSQLAPSPRADAALRLVEPRHVATGIASGVNIAPGAHDDGWTVPPPVHLHDGTRLQLYKDGEALRAAYDAINAAQRRICLEVYIFASDETGRAFADLLCRKAGQGVRVYVIYDSFGSMIADRAMFRQLRRAGVAVEEFHPVRPWECRYSWRPANRDHRKLLVIDEHIAGVGGLNIGQEYAGSWVVPSARHSPDDPWRDNAIGLIGPSARFFLHSFAHSWHYVTHGGRLRTAELIYNLHPDTAPILETPSGPWRHPGPANLPPPSSAGFHRQPMASSGLPARSDLGLLASVPTMSNPLARFLQDLVHDARKSILLTAAYFAPSDGLIDELCRAVRRGVQVRLMLPARCDVSLLLLAARSFYDQLLSTGVEIYERQHAVLHAKTLVIDAQTTVLGSTNLDYRSIEYNCELSGVIRSSEFGRQMHVLFEHDVRYSRPIALGEWRRRPIRDRLVQWAVNRSRYLL